MNYPSFFTNVKKYGLLVFLFSTSLSSELFAQRGYFDAPYKRYEADVATLSNGASSTSKSYSQADLQSEASDQKCVNLFSTNATLVWNVIEAADGLVVRYSVPDGQTGTVGIYNGSTKVTTLTLTSNWSWESLWNNGNPNNGGISNKNPKMRFDEVRYKLPTKIANGGQLKIIRESGNVSIDFAELEPVPVANTAPVGAAVYSGNGSDLQTFIDANGGKTIFVPTGVYNVNRELYIGASNTKLVGAGMWFTQLNFTNKTALQGGLRADASGVSFSDLYITTESNSRSNSYKGINGVFTSTSVVKNIWAIHFECGAWIAQYNTNGPAYSDGLLVTNCRFRNNYADGINFCKGTRNSIAEHCNFRNNGDDDQAMWSADGLECINNTFRYNTSENCWRASGLAIYGGKDNKAYNLIIKDNVEAGITINNFFPGVGFNIAGIHDFHDITISNCGTFNDIYNNRIAAVAISCRATAGTKVENVKLTNIDIIDSKDTGIGFTKVGGDGFYNFALENININGTGKEFPNNNINNLSYERGFFVGFFGSPNGNATFCNMTYTNRGQNATTNVFTGEIGTFAWTQKAGCGTTTVTQTPYAGVINLPGTVEAENYDNGGEGVAYHDNDANNITNTYRTDGVDIETCSEGGFNMNYSNNGEWTEYTVNVASTGSYNIATRVASPIGGSFHIEIDGVNVTGASTVPNTGGWQNWVDVTKTVSLTAGQHIMRFFIDTKEFNTNKFVVTPVTVVSTSNYFTIQNRWKGTYLYDAGANVGYGTTVAGNNYKWEKVAVDATYFRLKNLGTGEFMNIENLTGSVQSTAVQTAWASAQWSQESVDVTYIRFRSKWQTTGLIHVENQTGSAQYANGQDGWFSAQWKLTPISSTARVANEPTNDESGASLDVFPNPSSDGKFTVKVSGLENDLNYSLILHNIQGVAVSEQKIEADKNVNFSLKSGVYIIKLNSEKSSVAKKIVVQ
jgi:hypothetical protein